MNDLNLGNLITTPQQRDAVHIAVAPVVAAEELLPGQHVGFVDDGKRMHVCLQAKLIGIVDPFLKASVKPEEMFWLYLYPGSITSLRHDWTHPAFNTVSEKSESVLWIEAFAARLDQTYNRLVEAANLWAECEEYTYDNSEVYKRGGNWDKFEEFWKHYEIVTGTKVKDKSSFFTCSC